MTTAKREALVFTGEEMVEPVILPFGGGVASVFSTRAPDKQTANEDAAGLLLAEEGRGALVVADGVGGQSGGESASRIALASLNQALEDLDHTESIRGAILDGVERANERVLALGIGAATTLAALEIAGETLRPYHVGDSGILIVGQRGKVKLQTVAHSPVGYAVESGLLDEREALHHEQRHEISNMIGSTDMRIEVGSPLRMAPRDTALLATDGLFDNLDPGEVVQLVRAGPLERVARSLARRATERMRSPRAGRPSKPDDLTFVLYRHLPGGRRRS